MENQKGKTIKGVGEVLGSEFEEEFTAQDYHAENLDVRIRFADMPDADIKIKSIYDHGQFTGFEMTLDKAHVFTMILQKDVLAGVLMNRLNKLYDKHLLKKATEEQMR